jgi:transcriptional regulator with XRE-family HTH domain
LRRRPRCGRLGCRRPRGPGRVCRLRAERGLSQEALAHECGINRTYLSGVERSERNVSIDNIARIARGLRIDTPGSCSETSDVGAPRQPDLVGFSLPSPRRRCQRLNLSAGRPQLRINATIWNPYSSSIDL